MQSHSLKHSLKQYSSLLVLLILIVIGSNILFPGATSLANIYSMSTYGVELGLIALGSALIILGGAGGIDLSVGAMYALTQIIAAQLMVNEVNMWIAVLVALIAGILMGTINGYLVTNLRIPAIITTLATMYAYSSFALLLSNGVNISNLPNEFAIFGQGIIFGTPFQLLVVYAPIFLFLSYLLSRSAYGYQLYLTGTNDASAKLSGINTGRVRLWAYIITGLLCAISGIIGSSRLLTARPDAGDILSLQAITIAVLGGISIFGGKGTMIGTFLSTIVIAMIAYIFNLININAVIQTGVIGGILILVTLNQNRMSGLPLFKKFSKA